MRAGWVNAKMTDSRVEHAPSPARWAVIEAVNRRTKGPHSYCLASGDQHLNMIRKLTEASLIYVRNVLEIQGRNETREVEKSW